MYKSSYCTDMQNILLTGRSFTLHFKLHVMLEKPANKEKHEYLVQV